MGVLVLDERVDDHGATARTTIVCDGNGTVLLDDGAGLQTAVPVAYVAAVMQRYGRPLERGIEAAGAGVDLGAGRALRSLQFRAAVDVDPRDYVVFEAPDAEPLAAIGRDVAGALVHLARAGAALH